VDELIKLVSRKVGISEAVAKQAADTVLVYLKARLPARIVGQIDSLLGTPAGPETREAWPNDWAASWAERSNSES
jgi:hypothetical protein